MTSLFFLWGLAHSLLDVLNKHFQEILGVTKAQSGLVQTAVYGGYFIMAIPAGMLMKKVGYRNGIITGLLVFIPFLIIDFVVSSVLMSMGMMMLPPSVISLPFKVLFFILIDGWNLLVSGLVRSFF